MFFLITAIRIFIEYKLSLFTFKEFKNFKQLINPLFMTLAGKTGVGTLIGVSLAIYLSGYGAILWMIITGIIGSFISHFEGKMSTKYYEKKDEVVGGGYYFIEKATNRPKKAKLYAFILFLTLIIGFVMIQTSTLMESLIIIFDIPKLVLACLLLLLTYLLIKNGKKGIIHACDVIVPILCLILLSIGIYIIIKNSNLIKPYFIRIIEDAKSLKGMTLGVIIESIIIALRRGIFANESGLGTVYFSATTYKGKSEEAMGTVESIAVIFVSVVITSIVGFIIYSANLDLSIFDTRYLDGKLNGIEVLVSSFYYHLGSPGVYTLALLVFIFGLSTIIVLYFYGLNMVKYLNLKIKSKLIYFLLLLILVASFIKVKIIWYLTDILVACALIINLSSILEFFYLKNLNKKNT